MITLAITLILIIIPIKYVLLSFSMDKPKTLDEYHTADHKIQPHAFIDSSVAYGLQVAALTLFATWGFQYGFWVIWVPLFWMMGYIFLAKLITKGVLDDILISQETDTIHGFIGKRLSPSLTYYASFISLVAIIGTAMYEANFAGSFSSDILFSATNSEINSQMKHNLEIVLFASFVLVAASYMILAGFRAIVYTDRVQLFIGLLSFSGVLSLLSIKNAQNGFKSLSLMLILLTILLLVALSIYWHFQAIPDSPSICKFRISWALLSIFTILVISIIAILAYGTNNQEFKSLNAINFSSPFGFGWALLLNLFVANSLYQIVDVGQYQRLISVDTNHKDIDTTRSSLARANTTIGLYSAFSWFLAIIFGILLKAFFYGSEVDAYSIVTHFGISLLNGDLLSTVMLLLLLLSILCLMFSSLDSYIAGISFTIDTDIASRIFKTKSLFRPRIVTAILMIVGFSIISYLFPYLKSKYGFEYVAEFLYLCWAFQICLLPLIIGAFFRINTSAWLYFLSVTIVIIAALIPFLRDVYSVYQYSAWFAALGSMGVFGIGLLIGFLWTTFMIPWFRKLISKN